MGDRLGPEWVIGLVRNTHLGCSDSSGSNPTKTMDYYFIDELGNRDRREVYTGSWTKTYYCANEVNEYFVTKDAESAINCATEDPNRTHDDNGNLTSDPDFSYTYDYANRLVKVMDGQDTVAEYWFDALGRRIKKDDQTTVTHFYYHGGQVFEEYSYYDQSETLEARYLYGDEGIDDVKVMMRSESGTLDAYYYYHKNSLGSIVAVTDDSGDLAEQYSYDPYGTVYMKDGNGDDLSASAIKNPYLFTGRRYDEETGKYYYRARQYDPDTGRFMQRDPIGYVDGMSLYEYVQSNPVSRIDPFGLDSPGGGPQAKDDTMRAPFEITCEIKLMEEDLGPDSWINKDDSVAKVWGWADLECDENGHIYLVDDDTGSDNATADDADGGRFTTSPTLCENDRPGIFVEWRDFFIDEGKSPTPEAGATAGGSAGFFAASGLTYWFTQNPGLSFKAGLKGGAAGAVAGTVLGGVGNYFFDNVYHLNGWMKWKACCVQSKSGIWKPNVKFKKWQLKLSSNDTEYYGIATANPGPKNVHFRGTSIIQWPN